MRASERAYQALRHDIMNGHLEPGAVLAEVDLAERVGVSRTPIREALSRLLADGLVEHEGRGFLVAPISLQKVHELFEFRQALDSATVALAAQRGDALLFGRLAKRFEQAAQELTASLEPLELDRYYQLVVELDEALDSASGNSYLVAAQQSLRLQLARIRKLSKTNPERLAQAAREHAQIASAIAAGHAQLAQAASTVHLAHALASIEKALGTL